MRLTRILILKSIKLLLKKIFSELFSPRIELKNIIIADQEIHFGRERPNLYRSVLIEIERRPLSVDTRNKDILCNEMK